MLRNGSSGQEVEKLQRGLKYIGFKPGPIDGIFGPKTDAAVRAFQEHAKLAVDGIVGPKTLGALQKALDDMARKTQKQVTSASSSGSYMPPEQYMSKDDDDKRK